MADEQGGRPGGLAPEDVAALLDAVVAAGRGIGLDVVLGQIVEGAARLLEARHAALGILDEDRARLVGLTSVGLDPATAAATGCFPEGHGILGRLIVRPEALWSADLTTHPDSRGFPAHHPPMRSFLGVPVRAGGDVFANLYLADKRGGRPFDEIDEVLATTVAAVAGTAVDNAALHAGERGLRVADDRERIARELHDSVIQRIFATGLALEGLAAQVGESPVAARLRALTGELDETVRHLRSTIFGLQRSRLPGRSVRNELLALVADLGRVFGLSTSVCFAGPVDTALSGPAGAEVGDAVLAVAREAVTNVGRHARATRVEVDVTLQGDLEVRVVDDGAGLAGATTAVDGRGLANLRARARAMGGAFAVATDRSGTELTWRVPLGAQAGPGQGGAGR